MDSKKQQICAERYSPRIKSTPLRQTFASFHSKPHGKASISVYRINARRAGLHGAFSFCAAHRIQALSAESVFPFRTFCAIIKYTRQSFAGQTVRAALSRLKGGRALWRTVSLSRTLKKSEHICVNSTFTASRAAPNTTPKARALRRRTPPFGKLAGRLHALLRRRRSGKTVFLSIDSRATQRNPLYKAWKSKSFTDKDITLHFLLFDILSAPEVKKNPLRAGEGNRPAPLRV